MQFRLAGQGGLARHAAKQVGRGITLMVLSLADARVHHMHQDVVVEVFYGHGVHLAI